VRNGVGDRAKPFEAQIAVARRDRQARHLGRGDAGAMDVELPVAEPVSVADGRSISSAPSTLV
jgi:hypothetical protein